METTTTQTAQVRQSTGRFYLWLGIAAPFIGVLIYVVQLQNRILKLPWYLPIFGTAGVLLVILALTRKRTIWRFGGLVLVGLLAAFQWFFVSGGLKLPAYTGPVADGNAFPAFTATFADATPFTQDSFRDKNTALVFFRGRW